MKRRSFLGYVGAALSLRHLSFGAGTNPVITENALPGTSQWTLTNPATNREIEGYAGATSVNAGQQINLYVSTADPFFTIDVFRTGWYAGLGARLMTTITGVAGTTQTTPQPSKTTGMYECQWSISYTLAVPTTWISGIYLARLTGSLSGKQSYIIFVVRQDSRTSAFLYFLSVTTFQAYNWWPNATIGRSLYDWGSPNGRGTQVSFNRPYGIGANSNSGSGVGAGEYLTNLQPGPPAYPINAAAWGYNMVRWLEQNGYDVSYATSIDLHGGASSLYTHNAFLFVGHDEYWSMPMRQSANQALQSGISLGFFCANSCYWQIRLQAGFDGTANRTIVCFKDYTPTDPNIAWPDPYVTSNPSLATVLWREAPVSLPEAQLLGVMYIGDPIVNGTMTVANASHWLFNYTGLTNGEGVAGLLGYEVDGIFSGIGPTEEATSSLLASPALADSASPSPSAHANYYGNLVPGTFSTSKALTAGPDTTMINVDTLMATNTAFGTSNSTWYVTGSAGVFASGSIEWAWGLDDYNAPTLRPAFSSAAAKQITTNILAALGNPITITVSSSLSAIVGQAFSQTLSVFKGVPPLTWSGSGLPSWLSLSGGALSGTPTQNGSSTFYITVTDSNLSSATAEFTIMATGGTTPLSITTITLPEGTVGVPYSATILATGGTPPYTWSISGLPSVYSFSTSAGTITGTPPAAGSATLQVTVTDSAGNNFSKTFAGTVVPALTLAANTLPAGTVGSAYSFTLSASGGQVPYTWSASGLPSGLSISTAGVISGTPTAAFSGSVKVIVLDALGNSPSQTLSLTIAASSPLQITTTALPPGTAGTAYSFTLSASGGKPGYTWSASGLPSPLTISSAGAITGTPTASSTSSVTITVTDSSGAIASAIFTLTIASAALSITTTSLPTAHVGVAYSTTLAASGGKPPYTWSISGLPPGFSLNTSTGTISGTAVGAGSVTLQVTVKDSSGATSTKSLTGTAA